MKSVHAALAIALAEARDPNLHIMLRDVQAKCFLAPDVGRGTLIGGADRGVIRRAVQVGPDRGHSPMNQDRMMEFFIENLVMHPERIFKS